MELVVQILIVVFSGSAIWFVNQDKSWSKWGNVLGLIGQPLWLFTTYSNEQWGMFALTIFYIYCWAQGVYNKFIKTKKCENVLPEQEELR